MAHYTTAVSTLTAAIGLALGMQMTASADEMKKAADQIPQIQKDNMARAVAGKLEHCYGINAVGKNDCAVGTHSCAGQATKARDPKSFVLLPAGDCGKIEGGKTKES